VNVSAATCVFLLASGCVVTTLEGPGDPPRIAPLPGRTEAELARAAVENNQSLESVSARHLLVAYQGALRASPTIVRTKEQAMQRAAEALARARGGEDFEKLVREFSDEPGAAERAGDLGRFRRSQMVKPFADAAFKLLPGELSEVVETEFGFHVIQRTE
jgi:parvulin-like peptidyl-prolyl isomerase